MLLNLCGTYEEIACDWSIDTKSLNQVHSTNIQIWPQKNAFFYLKIVKRLLFGLGTIFVRCIEPAWDKS